MISMTISLQASRSLVSPHSSVSMQFVMALMSSSHRARGLPLFLAPPPIPNIIDFGYYQYSNTCLIVETVIYVDVLKHDAFFELFYLFSIILG